MTDRVHALTVMLEKEYREDDVEALVEAIKIMRGVLKVELRVADIDFYTAREQAKHELQQQLRAVLWP